MSRAAPPQRARLVRDVLKRSPEASSVPDADPKARWTEAKLPLRWFDAEREGGHYTNEYTKKDWKRVASITQWAASQNKTLAQLIQEHPILAYECGEIMDGYHRLAAAKQAGLRRVTTLICHKEAYS